MCREGKRQGRHAFDDLAADLGDLCVGAGLDRFGDVDPALPPERVEELRRQPQPQAFEMVGEEQKLGEVRGQYERVAAFEAAGGGDRALLPPRAALRLGAVPPGGVVSVWCTSGG
ncbi:hypothetical protein Srubr_19360 [Streptomyces rubradiris]|uniref:Uncharacterized protein n=1 Tax=Streptomyces rubradiris TaxID=285531 RepID=A0ABQ3R8B2_STRRR|nr:hypothetical protein GCM10018792_59100 [Streptomyces rubradiris]GHI52090.1 hypothetical protein Srubr_19360 [Streptomyces rubradiris]